MNKLVDFTKYNTDLFPGEEVVYINCEKVGALEKLYDIESDEEVGTSVLVQGVEVYVKESIDEVKHKIFGLNNDVEVNK